MIVTVMQPAYLPWLGFFDRLLQSELLVLLDTVSMDMSSKTRFTNRNKIRTQEGSSWLTVPVNTKGKHGNAIINQLDIINDTNWKMKHLRSIEMNYSKAPFYNRYISFFREVYKQDWVLLVDLIDEIFFFIVQELNIHRRIIKSSDLNVEGHKDDLILNICKYCQATQYMSGPFGRAYLELEKFKAAGIEVSFHDYQHPEYRQVYEGFVPYMSTIDLLFNYGPQSVEVLKSH